MRKLLVRVLNQKQLLILERVGRSQGVGLTYLLTSISESDGIALSTLKSSAKTLRDTGLIEVEVGKGVRLGRLGRAALRAIRGSSNE